jgi:hypothetical protein
MDSDNITIKYRSDKIPIEFLQDMNDWKALDFVDIHINNMNSALNFTLIDIHKNLIKEVNLK